MAKSEYYTILTKIGIAKFIAARASGNGINLKSFKLSSKVIKVNVIKNQIKKFLVIFIYLKEFLKKVSIIK